MKEELTSQEKEVLASVEAEREALWQYLQGRFANRTDEAATRGDILVTLAWAIGKMIGERQLVTLDAGMAMVHLANEQMVTTMCDTHNKMYHADEYAAQVAKNKGRLQ